MAMQQLEKTRRPFSISREIAICRDFTETFRKHSGAGAATREAACLAVQFPACMCAPQPGDLFAGRLYSLLVQFSPQPDFGSVGYGMDGARARKLLESGELSPQDTETLESLRSFWRTACTEQRIRESYPDEVRRWLKYEDYMNCRAVAHPLYRLSGTQLDYGKLLTLGVDGLHRLISSSEESAGADSLTLYKALHDTLNIFGEICENYVLQIGVLIKQPDTAASWAVQLERMSASLKRIAHEPPGCLYDAVQLVYLWWLFSGTLNFARMDTYLAPYYTADVDSGLLAEDEALEIMCGFWRMLELRGRVYDTRAVLGGRGRTNPEGCDRFCILAINATRRERTVVPQLALRLHSGMNPAVYDSALKAIGEGCTFPMLYNDDVNIPAVSRAFCVSPELAESYCPFGCGEYVFEHRSLGTPSGIINLAKALEMAMNHGIDMETGESLAPDFGGLGDYADFDELLSSYKKQVEHFVRLLAKQEELEYRISGKEAAFLPISLLYDDCVSRGRALLQGGVRYLGGTLEAYGNVNAADSLTAIKQLVYDTGAVTPAGLLKAMRENFSGAGALRRKLLDCPKYGNDDDVADRMMCLIHDHICETTRDSMRETDMHSYLTVLINNDANTVLGHLTSAGADGRLSGTHLANANNPQGGADQNGLTAMLNSIVKPRIDHHAGSVQNLKLSRELFNPRMLQKTKTLLDAYFAKGGSQLMITVVSMQEMEDAVLHPENHRDLIVRVGGFSARFVELGADVQQELLSRSLYS